MARILGWVGLALFVLASGGDAPERLFYVDIPLEEASVRELARQGEVDIGGFDHDHQIATLIIPEHALERWRGAGALRIREIARVPDAQFTNADELETFLARIEQEYPHLARVESIGRSVEGREIRAVELTDRNSHWPKRAVVIDAMHHAREVMVTEVAMDIIDYLTSRHATDPQVQKWLRESRVWVVPMLNPDGNGRVWGSQPMWRKNTQGGHGVDNNRNYPEDWAACGGSSGSKGSETYRGSAAASEPETRALMDLVARVKPVFNLSYHSFSEIVIYPFGCSPKRIPEPDRKVYERVGKELASRLVKDSGSGNYRAGTAYELLYNVDGGSIDWMYQQQRVMSFVIEVNGSNQGFQPSYTQWRDKTVTRQRAGWQYILERLADTELPSRHKP